MEKFQIINGFQIENAEKLERVVLGVVSRGGVLEGGLGVDAEPELVLAHYDKLAGFITKDGVKVKTGSFWDFKARAPRKEPQIMFIFNIGGDNVEVDNPSNLHKAIEVVGKARAEKEEKVRQAKKKSKFSKSE